MWAMPGYFRILAVVRKWMWLSRRVSEDSAAPRLARREGVSMFVGTDSVVGPRSSNQDRAYADSTVLALFDGVSGRTRGDIAASLALAEALRALAIDAALDRFDLPRVLVSADQALRDLNLKTGMTCATTGVLVAVRSAESGPAVAHVAWAGDSAAYLVRDGRISRLTRAHHKRDVTGQENPNALSKWLGGEDSVRPSVVDVPVERGDRLVLVSDGVTGVMEDRRIGSIVASGTLPAESAQLITSAALRGRTPDNATAVVAHLEDDPLVWAGTAAGFLPRSIVPPASFRSPPLASAISGDVHQPRGAHGSTISDEED